LARLAGRRRATASALALPALVGHHLISPHPTPTHRACCDIWVFASRSPLFFNKMQHTPGVFGVAR